MYNLNTTKEGLTFRNNLSPGNFCLGVKSTRDNTPIMTSCEGKGGPGLGWRKTQIPSTHYYTLTNNYSKDKDKKTPLCLEALKGNLEMNPCNNNTTQRWIIPGGNNPYMQNGFYGSKKCVDIINDNTRDKLTIADCINSSGQQWAT